MKASLMMPWEQAIWLNWASEQMSDGVGDTPQTITTTRAPAVLKMHIFDFFRDIFSVFLGVKFGFRKSCLCKRNDKYEVWDRGSLIRKFVKISFVRIIEVSRP